MSKIKSCLTLSWQPLQYHARYYKIFVRVFTRDNHNHYTSLRLLFLTIIFMSTHAILGVFLTCMWEKLMFSLSIIFILLLTIYDPHATQKASVGMYSGCDYLLSLKILFVYFLALPSLLHPSILFLHLFLFFFIA